MSSPLDRARNNVRAGIFVTATLLVALGVIIVLSDIWDGLTRPVDQYTVTFDVAGGVRDLGEGADVRIGGVVMGRVLAVRPRIQSGEAFDKIDVAGAV